MDINLRPTVMAETQRDWLAFFRPSYWYSWWTWTNELLPAGMELEKLAIIFICVVLIPTIVGAILGIIWNIIWVFIVGLFILLGSVILFKAILPRAPCSTADIIISILISAGLYIPTLILDGISSVMSMANSNQDNVEDRHYNSLKSAGTVSATEILST